MRACALACAVGLSACARPHESRTEPPRALPTRWHYDVTLDAELSRIDARVCFEGAVPAELRAGKDEAAGQLRYARWLSPGSVHKLDVIDGRVQLDAGARDACIAYGVDLTELRSMDVVLRRTGRSLIASPNVWLWRPQRRAERVTASLRLHLPAGVNALLPWPREGDAYALDGQAFRFDSYAAFGPFDTIAIVHRGVPIEAALLDGPYAIDRAGVERWLRFAVDTVSIAGQFPARQLRVLAAPAGLGGEPVAFGMVARGGSGSVLLFLGEDASEAALRSDWVLPHELSHLWLPFVEREHAWLSEGLATYLQEVLRARSGAVSKFEGLSGLARGMGSARHQGTGRAMRDESRDMHRTFAYRSVYWAGAAFFLRADVELRRRTNNARSLDTVLTALHAAGDYGRTFGADELLARMDELAGEPVFAPLAAELLTQPFPDVEPTFAALGLGEGTLLDDAPLAGVRRALLGE